MRICKYLPFGRRSGKRLMPRTIGVTSSSSMPPTTANNWSYVSIRAAGDTNEWVSITESNGVFITVSTPSPPGAVNRLAISTDGYNWTRKTDFDFASWNTGGHVTSADENVYACFGDEIYKSTNSGNTWSLANKFNNANIAISASAAISKEEGGTSSSYFGFISAIGTNNSSPAEWYSTNYGSTWSNGIAPSAAPNAITCGTPTDGNTYIVVALAGSPYIQYKIPSGTTSWTNAVFSGSQSPSTNFGAIYYADNRFVAIDDNGRIFSTNPSTGMTFVYRATLSGFFNGGLSYGDGCWVAAHSNGTKIATSLDAITWVDSSISGTSDISTNTINLTSITYGSGKFVATGGFGGNILTSDDESRLPILSGGTTISQNGFRLHTFTSSTSTSTLVNVNSVPVNANYLVVGGGGSGGRGSGGGGGAGGVLTGTVSISSNQTVTVGSGGAARSSNAVGATGNPSSIGSLVSASGGGGGGATYSAPATNGGSGGGATYTSTNGYGTGIAGQGNRGGSADGDGFGLWTGGGGGGASSIGGNGGWTGSQYRGGNGGTGVTVSVAGGNVIVGGGGGGFGATGTGGTINAYAPGSGGTGGGGSAGTTGSATSGTINTGGGGGGCIAGSSGAGGSGVIYIWYTV